MKKISVVIPTYNEEENVKPMAEAVTALFDVQLEKYDYEIIFIDNCSKDKTRELLGEICKENKKVKAIFNAKNFGQFNSPYYGLLQATGDCAVLLAADFQDPVEMIPVFVEEWEKGGYNIVCGIKTSSKENKLVYLLRSIYYKLIKKMSDVEQIEHFTGFALYDKSFIEVLRKLDDPKPFLRGIVAELGGRRKDVPYTQPRRRAGKTKNNWYSLYDAAMLSFTSYTKIGLRLATFAGFFVGIASFVIGIVYLILKLMYWNLFAAGQAPILLGMLFLGAIQLIFIGFLGEYIISINSRVMKRPLVVEERRLNFDDEQ
ncbi:MAG: glycosyltransferase [Clostridia bacterium]|nr:glycosyltransferase [Clostridia bacterium]